MKQIRKTAICIALLAAALLCAWPVTSHAENMTRLCDVCEDVDCRVLRIQPATYEEEGSVDYQCPNCGRTYTEVLAQLEEKEADPIFAPVDESDTDTLSVYVGYWGAQSTEIRKVTLSLQEIMDHCEMVTNYYSFTDKFGSMGAICYGVGYGVRLKDVLAYAGVNVDAIARYNFVTADSDGGYYYETKNKGQEMTESNLYAERYFFRDARLYFDTDRGEFSDIGAVWETAEQVEPMLAIWSSYKRYDTNVLSSFMLGEHNEMESKYCFRLMFGQKQPGEQTSSSAAYRIQAVYIRYAGTPEVDQGEDFDITVEKADDLTYAFKKKLTFHVTDDNGDSYEADETVVEEFQENAIWQSGDASILEIDRNTGVATVKGKGTVTVTATVYEYDTKYTTSWVVTVGGNEDIINGGGSGTDTGDGKDTGTGEGTDTDDGTGTDKRTDTGDGTDTTPDADKKTNPDNGSDRQDDSKPQEKTDAKTEETADDEKENDTVLTLQQPVVAEKIILPESKTQSAEPVRLRQAQMAAADSGGESGGATTLQLANRIQVVAICALVCLVLGILGRIVYYRKQRQ